ncbi:MAG: ABC transporter permease [Spirochaetaceae bacterium]|nr:ABC transporter permease [Spirochaetaceae bacterium]
MNSQNNAVPQTWDKIIKSKSKLIDLKLKQVWEYRDLIGLFVKRDFIIYYKQTILGPLWYLLQPVFSTIMYMLIFGRLAGIGTDGIPQILFYFSGTMLWTYFSTSLVEASKTFSINKGIFSKVYFPRLTVPIATSIGFIIKLAIQFALFAILYIYYYVKGADIVPSFMILLFPVIVIWLGLLATGIGMIISSITTKYRDIALTIDFLVQLVMYATPVVYPLSEVPESLTWLFYANPVSAPVEFFRVCFFGVGSVPLNMALLSIGITVLCLFFGLVLFNQNEKSFVDVI